MSVPLPLILDDAGIKLGDGAEPEVLAELACVANHVELAPDTAVTTLDTMCGSIDYPGAVKWSLVLTLYQSFDPGATEDVLSAAVAAGGPVGFELVGYKSKPVGPENPQWSGQVIPQAYPPINGDAGDASTIELEWAVLGEPVKSVTPVAFTLSESPYAAMSLDELRSEAERAGLPTSGTKAELAERLAGEAVPA